MTDPDYYQALLPDFHNEHATVFVRSLPDKRYVWVNDVFQRDHGGYGNVIGKTQVEVFGAVNAKPWELTDSLTDIDSPTTTVEPYGERRYALTKFIVTDSEGKRYIAGIGMEVTAKNRNIFDRRLRELTDKLLEQLRSITL